MDKLRTAAKRGYGGPLVRLHIGLEEPDDLIADLERALANYPNHNLILSLRDRDQDCDRRDG